MSLVKRTYVDDETVITAQNLNDIQDEVIANRNSLTTVEESLNNVVYAENLGNLSSYTGKTLIDYVVTAGYELFYTSASGSNRLSDLPINIGGLYVVFANTYYKKVLFYGNNGVFCRYTYDTGWDSSNLSSFDYDQTKMSSTTGSIQSSSFFRCSYNHETVSINYYIRVKDPNGRPTITISDIPTAIKGFLGVGNPTHGRIGSSGNVISDSSYVNHLDSGNTISINMYNYLGEVPSGTGYLILSGSMTF